MMWKQILTFFFMGASLIGLAQVKIGLDTLPPDSSAALEVRSAERGFLGPRLSIPQIKNITNPAEALFVYNSSTKQFVFFNGVSWQNFDGTKAFPETGDTLAGGLIFYLDSSGIHGMVCAFADQSVNSVWYPGTFPPPSTGATGTAVGTGHSNTAAIISVQGPGDYAAEVCDSLEHEGYDDWFLPSTGELGLMRSNLHLKGTGNFNTVFQYWSSTEKDQYDAWKLHFLNGSLQATLKLNSNRVRCVRAF